MPMAPMRAGDVIIFPQGSADAGGNTLLPDIEMGKSGYLTAGVKIYDSIFKEATFHHCRIKFKEFVFVYFHESPPHQKTDWIKLNMTACLPEQWRLNKKLVGLYSHKLRELGWPQRLPVFAESILRFSKGCASILKGLFLFY
jgi:hypothetical protein